MFCPNCGKEVGGGAVICLGCGVAVRPDVRVKKKTRFTGFILSLVAAFSSLMVINIASIFSNAEGVLISTAVVSVLLIVSLIASINDLKKARQEGGLKSYPIAGIIASSFMLLVSILVILLTALVR